jgi:hypothetical protein
MNRTLCVTGIVVSLMFAARAAAEADVGPDAPTAEAGCATATDLPCSVNDFRACRGDPRGFYAVAEALFYSRTNSAWNQPLVLNQNTVPPAVLLTTRDLDFDFSPGVRVRAGYRLNECFALELEYMGVFDSDAGATVVGNNNLSIPGTLGLQSDAFFGADRIDVAYSSDLHGVEVNFVKWCECCCCCDCCSDTCCTQTRRYWRDWFFGFRYLRLGEEFNIHGNAAGQTGDYNIHTYNDLFGPQVGTRWGWARGRLGCELSGKAGLFGNSCGQQQYVTDFPGIFIRDPIGHDGGRVSFVGELGATLTYQLTRTWTARAGYNLLWLEGVALAPDQLDFTNVGGISGSRLNFNGSAFFHGASVGLEARW